MDWKTESKLERFLARSEGHKSEWTGAWHEAKEAAEALGIDVDTLLSYVGEHDWKEVRMENGQRTILIASRWEYGEEETRRRDLERLGARAED